MRTSPLGTDRFGQTGDLPDLYRTYRLDTEAIIDAALVLSDGQNHSLSMKIASQ